MVSPAVPKDSIPVRRRASRPASLPIPARKAQKQDGTAWGSGNGGASNRPRSRINVKARQAIQDLVPGTDGSETPGDEISDSEDSEDSDSGLDSPLTPPPPPSLEAIPPPLSDAPPQAPPLGGGSRPEDSSPPEVPAPGAPPADPPPEPILPLPGSNLNDPALQPVPPVNAGDPESPLPDEPATTVETPISGLPTTSPTAAQSRPDVVTVSLPPAADASPSIDRPVITTTSLGSFSTGLNRDPSPWRSEAEVPSSPTSSTSTSTRTTITPQAANSPSSTSQSSSSSALPTGDSRDDGRRAMDPDTEHALIAVGSIGSFIFASFIVWVLYRTVKKARQRRRQRQMAGMTPRIPPPPPKGFNATQKATNRFPFLAKLPGFGWYDRKHNRQNDPPPSYEKSGGLSSLYLENGSFAPDFKPAVDQMGAASWRKSQVTFLQPSPMAVQPAAVSLARSNTANAQNGTFSTESNGTLTTIVADYEGGSEPDATGAGVVYYGQGQPASHQYTQSYRNSRRHLSRGSELSSISSGFGDGDVFVPGMTPLQPPPAASHPLRSMQTAVGRYSWASKSSSKNGNSKSVRYSPKYSSNRETVYTEASEDSPPRFRTVHSWVNQQTGRVRRAQARVEGDGDVPPVPGLPVGMPPEQRFTMMMPDGEEPRRPESHEKGTEAQ